MKTITPVNVTVSSVIDNLEDGMPVGDQERTLITAPGSLTNDDGIITIRYAEDGEEGQHTDCTLIYRDGAIALSRRGSVSVDLMFEVGETCTAVYSVPPYKFDMTVTAKKIRSSLTDRGGEIQLIYDMNIGGQDKRVRMYIAAVV